MHLLATALHPARAPEPAHPYDVVTVTWLASRLWSGTYGSMPGCWPWRDTCSSLLTSCAILHYWQLPSPPVLQPSAVWLSAMRLHCNWAPGKPPVLGHPSPDITPLYPGYALQEGSSRSWTTAHGRQNPRAERAAPESHSTPSLPGIAPQGPRPPPHGRAGSPLQPRPGRRPPITAARRAGTSAPSSFATTHGRVAMPGPLG